MTDTQWSKVDTEKKEGCIMLGKERFKSNNVEIIEHSHCGVRTHASPLIYNTTVELLLKNDLTNTKNPC